MTNNYLYKSINLNNLITDINSSVGSSFTNITTNIGTNVTDLKTMEKSANLNYTENGTDISTKTRAKNISYDTIQTSTEVNLVIPGTTSIKYTHFTAYLRGGSGGGGGAGGDGESPNGSNIDSLNSKGGTGGKSGYVALYNNIPLNGNKLYVSIGPNGIGGTKGADDNDKGQNGSPGNVGTNAGSSYIDLGNTRICTATGGTGGLGGGGATSGGNQGNTGADGTPGTGSITSGYTGATTTSPDYPTIDLNGGAGGYNKDGQTGIGFNGLVGYVRIYLKYIP